MFGNFTDIMKQASQMQAKFQEMQDQVAQLTETGSSGGNAVKVIMSGDGMVSHVEIDPKLMNDAEVLADLIKAATNDARKKIKLKQEEFTKNTFGGLLPPGMKLPF